MRRLGDRIGLAWAWGSSLGLLIGLAALLVILVGRGAPAMGLGLLFGETAPGDAILGRAPVFDGIWPALVGTLTLVGLACLVAVPIGVASGIYLAEIAPRRRRALFDLGVDMLAGVPSVVMGLFGFGMILLMRRTLAPDATTGLWLSALCIALLVLPYLIRTTQTALDALPESLRLVGPGLGLTRWQNVRWVLLPAAGRGVLGGVMLAVGRAAEDTAVIMLTGAVWNAGLPAGLAEKFEALPFRIYVLASEYRDEAQLAQGFACAFALLLLTAGLLVCAYFLQRSMERRWKA